MRTETSPAPSTTSRALAASADRIVRAAADTQRPHVATGDLAVAWQGDRGFFTNVAIPLVGPAEWDPLLERVAAIVPSQVPVSLVSAATVPDLRGRGWDLVGHPPLMARPAGPIDLPCPDELTITLVTDEVGLEVFERSLIDFYPDPDLQPHRAGDLYDGRVLGGATSFFVADVEGHPVGTASSHRAAGVNLLELLSVSPSMRRRGYGAALAAAAIGAGRPAPAVLLASDLGRPTYERLGFEEVERWTFWRRPARP